MNEIYTCECNGTTWMIYIDEIKCMSCGQHYRFEDAPYPADFNATLIERKMKDEPA